MASSKELKSNTEYCHNSLQLLGILSNYPSLLPSLISNGCVSFLLSILENQTDVNSLILEALMILFNIISKKINVEIDNKSRNISQYVHDLRIYSYLSIIIERLYDEGSIMEVVLDCIQAIDIELSLHTYIKDEQIIPQLLQILDYFKLDRNIAVKAINILNSLTYSTDILLVFIKFYGIELVTQVLIENSSIPCAIGPCLDLLMSCIEKIDIEESIINPEIAHTVVKSMKADEADASYCCKCVEFFEVLSIFKMVNLIANPKDLHIVIDLMKEYIKDTTFIKHCLNFLGTISFFPECSQILADLPTVETIIECIGENSHDEDIMQYAIQTIDNFATNNRKKCFNRI